MEGSHDVLMERNVCGTDGGLGSFVDYGVETDESVEGDLGGITEHILLPKVKGLTVHGERV